MDKKRKKRRLNGKKLAKMLCISAALLTVLCILGYYLGITLEKKTYRLCYPDEILKSTAEFGLDPYLAAAVIHCESSNDPEAVSPVGARGLMQIMPDTGGWIAEKLEIPDYGAEMLFDPETNVRMGCWYLDYLLNKFYGDRKMALAAYNAGPGNVAKWLENEKYSTGGVLVEIPFPETGQYIERVRRAYDKYVKLYQNELG